MTDYSVFLERKTQLGGDHGFVPASLPDFLFDFQRALVDWSIRKGRGAIFADCGMGKTPMQLVWASELCRHTGKPVLIVTPLAVGAQTIEEAAKFHIGAARSGDGQVADTITITNYERLEKFNPADFGGVVCDESSAIKSFDGVRRALVTDFMRKLPHRLLCTATAAPNDYIELGTSSEALGYLGHLDMLQRFFKNEQGNAVKTNRRWSGAKWRFKGHARERFWRWVCSWARAVRKPSDLGFSDDRFHLPPLIERDHVVVARSPAEGRLFDMPAVGLWEEREELRRTMKERCERAAMLATAHGRPVVVWCNLNPEGDLLERLIPGAIQVAGSNSLEEKEERFMAFSHGQARVLITKPKIGAWGLNWQHCSDVVFFPTHSYEQYYQAVRRCWRFGQTRPVLVEVVAPESGRGIMENLQRKAKAADQMFVELVAAMNHALTIERREYGRTTVEVPQWLR